VAEGEVKWWRRWFPRKPSAVDANLAGALNNLSNRLGELGLREEGLRAVQEAVETYRKLAAARPDAFLPYLATSLKNLSNRLDDLGRQEEAQRAAEEAEKLSASHRNPP